MKRVLDVCNEQIEAKDTCQSVLQRAIVAGERAGVEILPGSRNDRDSGSQQAPAPQAPAPSGPL